MKAKPVQNWIDDFGEYCKSVDVRDVVAAANEDGDAPGQAKQLYAIAIVRALHYGGLGKDWYEAQMAVCMLWERGHVSGFNTDTFNGVLEELRTNQRRQKPRILARSVELFSKAVDGR